MGQGELVGHGIDGDQIKPAVGGHFFQIPEVDPAKELEKRTGKVGIGDKLGEGTGPIQQNENPILPALGLRQIGPCMLRSELAVEQLGALVLLNAPDLVKDRQILIPKNASCDVRQQIRGNYFQGKGVVKLPNVGVDTQTSVDQILPVHPIRLPVPVCSGKRLNIIR